MLPRTRIGQLPLKNSNPLFARLYSFESGRKPKSGLSLSLSLSLEPEPDQLQPASNPKNDTPTGGDTNKPISGRGRRFTHRASSSSTPSRFLATPKLTLPFKPLSSNHLAHLKLTTLSLDLFFSLQRPLLEIELSPSQRRSITAESKQQLQSDPQSEASLQLEDDQEDDIYPQINSGSPSDPAFKPPYPSSARPPMDDHELDEHIWSTADPYSSYLITEPEGVHPAWSDALKRCLASSHAFQPPPQPKQTDLEGADTPLLSKAKQPNGTFQTDQQVQLDLDRKRALSFLAPYGLISNRTPDHTHSTAQANSESSNDPENGFEPAISQDPLSLTMQAARFLHSVMTANRWPEAANWTSIDSQLKAAEQAYSTDQQLTPTSGDAAVEKTVSSTGFPSIRGTEHATNSGRRNRSSPRWITIRAETEGLGGDRRPSISLNTDQLREIIKYTRKFLSQKTGFKGVPKSVAENIERFSEFLFHKNLANQLNLFKHPGPSSTLSQDPANTPAIIIIDPAKVSLSFHDHPDPVDGPHSINLDSVFRKKKRKMKVHKYKKRRKARNTLKKRQGK